LQDTDANRRMGCGLSIEATQGNQHLAAWRLKRVDPEVDWGAFGQRRPLLCRPVSEGALELGGQPLRIVAFDMSRRIYRQLVTEPGELDLR